MGRKHWDTRRERLREILRAIREEAGLTQMELAAKLPGRMQSYVSKYERGERKLDVVDVDEICSACGLDFVTFAQRYAGQLKG